MKLQSALEFIVTYSWEIIIIALFVASVFVLGGSKSPGYYVSSSCYITPLITCTQSVLTYNSVAPMRFALVFKNTLGSAMFLPYNSINVTASGVGASSASHFFGSCYPSHLFSGQEALCLVDIPSSVKPAVGTQVTVPFKLSYYLCDGPTSTQCTGSEYQTSGYSTQLVAPSSISIYSLSMNSSTKGAYIAVSGVSYPVNSTAFFVSNKYTIYARPPTGYAFSSWSISSLGSFLSSTTSQTTTLTLSSNATIIANFVVSTSTTSTSSSTSTTATSTSTTSTSTSTTSTSTSTTSTSTSTTTTIPYCSGYIVSPNGYGVTEKGECYTNNVASFYVYVNGGDTGWVSVTVTNAQTGASYFSNSYTGVCPLTNEGTISPGTGQYLDVSVSSGKGGGACTGNAQGELETKTTSTSTSTTSTSTSTTSTSTSISTTSTVFYVPITLTNSQGSATPAPFQQLIIADSGSYSSYEQSGLQNVEFTTSPNAQGTILDAWIEANASNTATKTIYWVKLPNGIGASSSITIYMNFMPTSVMSSSGPTGEAPRLSSTYGAYDDGADVFNVYQNFAGSSCPSGWSCQSGVTINNGATVDNANITSISQYSPQVLDVYVVSSNSNLKGEAIEYLETGGNNAFNTNQPYWGHGNIGSYYNGVDTVNTNPPEYTGTYIQSIGFSGSTLYWWSNYTNEYTESTSLSSSSLYYIQMRTWPSGYSATIS
ncbi:MAG: hypothetical protein ACP5FR_01995 [Candidatus Micrarchaeia archaeon]